MYNLFAGLIKFINGYIVNWKRFHEYWLKEYKGPILVVLYKDLVQEEISNFVKISAFLGFNATARSERLVLGRM